MRTVSGCLGSCLLKLVLWTAIAVAAIYLFTIALNPWALHIGHRFTPLLWWHGSGTVVAKGNPYPIYISFLPGRPRGFRGGGRREGKIIAANLQGNAWLCTAPGQIRRLNLSGEVYGGYASSDNSLFSFRLLDWRRPFTLTVPSRGFFDLSGTFHGEDLVMDRPNGQGVPFDKTLFIHNATATFHWSTYDDFASACSNSRTNYAK